MSTFKKQKIIKQPKYEKIFWLDDAPRFLSKLNEEIVKQGGKEALKFYERTTFAFTVEDAINKMQGKEFDLYILDGDFPQTLPEERIKELEEFIENEGRGELKRTDYIREAEAMFLEIYKSQLRFQPNQVIINSANLYNVARSHETNLPFFHKYSNNKESFLQQIEVNACEYEFDSKIELTIEQQIEIQIKNILNKPTNLIETSFRRDNVGNLVDSIFNGTRETGGREEIVRDYLLATK